MSEKGSVMRSLGIRSRDRALLILTLAEIVAGGLLRVVNPHVSNMIWFFGTLVIVIGLGWAVVKQLIRGEVGVDVIALLAMVAALSMSEYLAGIVVALMLVGGQALEEYANERAREELSELIGRAPRMATRYENDKLVERDANVVQRGDLLLVKPGGVVPVDGVVSTSVAVIDESALTGESVPVERRQGDQVLSGGVNAGLAFDLRAIASADESTYAGIVRLVESAQSAKAPFVRLADRYALLFLPVTLATTAVAWLISGDPHRALAVLVVATPCPLILAAPIAIISGVSRAAGMGIIIKGGGVLEALGRARTVVFDKTGTLTAGMPAVSRIEADDIDPDELIRLGASLDQVSSHVFAAAVVAAARERGLRLTFPNDVEEIPGEGISGTVDGHDVALGKAGWIIVGPPPDWAKRVRKRCAVEGAASVFVSVDGRVAGALILDDPVRSDAVFTIRALRRVGVDKIVMVTGDHSEIADSVGRALGLDAVLSQRSPAEKVHAVSAFHDGVGATVMVGDGINDAPALAAADVGVAMGARGAAASSQAADAVITVDRLDRLADAVGIAKRSRRIALQSVIVGMGLSFAAMGFATAGLLTPVAGALLQELIDVAVILNALRALRDDRQAPIAGADVGAQFRAEHRELLPEVERLRSAADSLDRLAPSICREELDHLYGWLAERLLPHELSEETLLFPYVARIFGGTDSTAGMTRTHVEISHLVRVLGRLLSESPDGAIDAEDLPELRRVLYGLHAILRLHFAQEEEAYAALGRTSEGESPALVASGTR
jgi:heavy metal translocating P-type ATPase